MTPGQESSGDGRTQHNAQMHTTSTNEGHRSAAQTRNRRLSAAWTARISQALRRSRVFALSIFLTYALSGSIGIAMAHGGNGFALAERDRIVHKAVTSDKASIDYKSGNRISALLHDFAGNLFFSAIPQTVGGLGVVLPYFSVAHQGWVGGIVSVNSAHASRLRNAKGATYYVLVLLLQWIPFSLVIGAGVKCGVDLYRSNTATSWRFWEYRLPRQTVVDLAWVFVVAVPLFLVASAFEFLSTWNV